VSTRVPVFAVDRCRKTLDSADKQLSILSGRALQVLNVALNLIGHLVE
jgi:hypothetical protein